MIKLEDIQAQHMLSSVVPEQILQAANWADCGKQLDMNTIRMRVACALESMAM